MKALLCTLVLLSGCASVASVGQISDTALPRVGAGLMAASDLYVAGCNPKPLPGLEKVCPTAHTAINAAIDGYTEVNSAVKAAQ